MQMLKNIARKIRTLITDHGSRIKLSLASLCLCVSVVQSPAGIYQLVAVGPNIPANYLTNFSTLVPIGTFTLTPQNMFFGTGNSVTNPFTAYGRLTFDGTNFFTLPQYFSSGTNAATLGVNGFTNLQWSTSNTVFTLYAALSVTNSMAYAITNFQAGLQY